MTISPATGLQTLFIFVTLVIGFLVTNIFLILIFSILRKTPWYK